MVYLAGRSLRAHAPAGLLSTRDYYYYFTMALDRCGCTEE